MITVEEFQAAAREWLAANRTDAPRDYGATCPPDLVDDAVAVEGDAGARDGEHRPRVGVRVRMVVGHEQGCPSFTVWRFFSITLM